MNTKIKRILAATMAAFTLCISVAGGNFGNIKTVFAEEDSHWYTQKGWTYNGKTLTSLCYITSYAMVLKAMGFDVDPVDVYVANGKSNFCNHSTIASYYGVDATSEAGSIDSKSAAEKQEFLINLINKYPQGVIVGGSYGAGTHYIVAKKVIDNTIYFDDPAYATPEQGCCIPVSGIYKLTWSTLDNYRVIKYKQTATPKATTTPKATATPKATTTPKMTATPKTSVSPTSSASVTATPLNDHVESEVITEGGIVATEIPKLGLATEEPTEINVNTPAPTATITATPNVTETAIPTVEPTATPEVINPLGKYTVPKRTIYYKTPQMKGDDVKWIEAVLKKLGYTISVNGKFSKADAKVLKKYQKKNKLSADGYAGKKTRAKLLSDIAIKMTKVNKVKGLILAETPESQLSMTASWSKVAKATGYQVCYSEKSDFSSKTHTIHKKKKSAVIEDLAKNKTYYVKVRAYIMVNGTRVYGSYCSTKKIKIS